MIPLDLWIGGHYPYICKFDFINSGENRQLDNPSNSFYISDTQSTPPKFWSHDGTSQIVQDSSKNSSASAAPLSNSKGTSATQSSGLSSGAIAGAVVGAMIGGALIAGIGTFFLLRRQRNQGSGYTTWSEQGYLPQNAMPNTPEDIGVGTQEKDARAYTPTPEMGESQITELDAGKRESRLGSP
ncbi:MAG: hypothetical protein L6R42_003173 [Xanthoria sp. 1 TBL-2021]|nr:MAG: hypothetical protein L6R42_003173 [Xanthoria sp. 1 TBL-2021]